MTFSLDTKRLILRDFRPGDFDAFYATSTDPAYRRFYPESELTESHWREIFSRILPPAGAGERLTYQLALCTREGGTLIGTCGVRVESAAQGQASFGCALARPYWGRGLAFEASRRLFDFAFATLPIERLYAETNAENEAARALAERLDMRLEGILRHHRRFRGRWWDTAIYAILKEEWTQQAG